MPDVLGPSGPRFRGDERSKSLGNAGELDKPVHFFRARRKGSNQTDDDIARRIGIPAIEYSAGGLQPVAQRDGKGDEDFIGLDRPFRREAGLAQAGAQTVRQVVGMAAQPQPQIVIKVGFHLRGDAEEPGTATVRSWLFAIAHNAIVDVRRRDRPTRSLDADPDPARSTAPATSSGELANPGIGPEELAVHRDELGRLIAVLGRLPDSQRQIIELRLAGLTTAEVADALGLTRPAVKAAQTRAYSRLRDLLEPPQPPPDDPRQPPSPAPPSLEELSR